MGCILMIFLNMNGDMALHLCRIRAAIAFEFAVPFVTLLVLFKAKRVRGRILAFPALEDDWTLSTTSPFLRRFFIRRSFFRRRFL